MSLQDAFFCVVHDYPGGAVSLAPRLGKSPTTLSHECTRTGTAKAGLLDAEKITLLTGDLRILETFAMDCGQMIVPLPDAVMVADNDCMLRLADSAREFGELCKEVATDLSNDGKISDNELRRIDKETGELIASLHALRESLARLNSESKPADQA